MLLTQVTRESYCVVCLINLIKLFPQKMCFMGIAGGYLSKIGKLYDNIECMEFLFAMLLVEKLC